MTIVVGTAGHIDHGKTTLLRALTGIDADRLPEERRRGMTIDVGYAHLALPDGSVIDFVDVPGHDRLVGNMLVGAGEIDAVMLVVAADDGLRPQTHEHLDLLDALAKRHGLVAITKTDLVPRSRVGEVVGAVSARLAGTSLEGVPVVPVSSRTGTGLETARSALEALRDAFLADRSGRATGAPRLAVDRVFAVKGRGVVVTGTLRGGPLRAGTTLRVEPAGEPVRVREIQVHGRAVDVVPDGGRTALNVAGAGVAGLRRGVVLTDDPAIRSSERMLAWLARPVADRTRFRLHSGTDAADAVIGRSGRDAVDLPDGAVAAILRLDRPVAVAAGDRFVLRRIAPASVVGGVVVDPTPARGASRRRQTPDRVAALAAAVLRGDERAAREAETDLHGIALAPGSGTAGIRVAADVEAAARGAALVVVTRHHAEAPREAGPTIAAVRAAVAGPLRGSATLSTTEAVEVASVLVERWVASGTLVRDGDRLRDPGHRPAAADPAVSLAMDRLERALDVLTPPPLGAAAASAGCTPDEIRELERAGRIVVLAPDLAFAASTYRGLVERALELARAAPLSPAAFRDATGTSRKYVMPILEDLDRRAILRRTPAGHVPGPRAPTTVGGPS